jgi:hypothetical protein
VITTNGTGPLRHRYSIPGNQVKMCPEFTYGFQWRLTRSRCAPEFTYGCQWRLTRSRCATEFTYGCQWRLTRSRCAPEFTYSCQWRLTRSRCAPEFTYGCQWYSSCSIFSVLWKIVLFLSFFLCQFIVCSSIYGYCLHICYLQTFLKIKL